MPDVNKRKPDEPITSKSPSLPCAEGIHVQSWLKSEVAFGHGLAVMSGQRFFCLAELLVSLRGHSFRSAI